VEHDQRPGSGDLYDDEIVRIATELGHIEEGCRCAPGADLPCPEVVADLRLAAAQLTPILAAATFKEAAADARIKAQEYRRLATDARDRRDDGDPDGARHIDRFDAKATALEALERDLHDRARQGGPSC
jgi:hypothetical protein